MNSGRERQDAGRVSSRSGGFSTLLPLLSLQWELLLARAHLLSPLPHSPGHEGGGKAATCSARATELALGLMQYAGVTKSGVILVTPVASCREYALNCGIGHLGTGSALRLREEVVPRAPL